jgi:hypothetical protein
MKNIAILIVFTAFFLSSCCSVRPEQRKSSTKGRVDASEFALIGRKGISIFPQMKVETSYLSDSTLHWKTTTNQGVVAEGDEKVSHERLEDHLHFLNWVEANGYVLSLIINTKEGKV